MKKHHLLLLILLLSIFTFCKKESNDNKPIVDIISPINNASFNLYEDIKITVEAYSAEGVIKEVTFYNNDTELYTLSEAPYVIKVSPDTEGFYRIGVSCMDNLNNTSEKKYIQFNVDDYGYTIESYHIGDAHVVVGHREKFNINAESPFGNIVSVGLYVNDTLVDNDLTAPYELYWDVLKSGEYKVISKATDSKGAIGQSMSKFFTVYESNTSECSIGWPYQDSYYDVNQEFNIHVSTSGKMKSIEKIELYLQNELISTLTNNNDQAKLGKLISGSYSLYAIAHNHAGRITISDTINFHVVDGIGSLGKISDIVAGLNDQTAYALDKTYNQLLIINPENNSYTPIPLPYSNPLSLAYSADMDRVYIVYEFTGSVSVFNPSNTSFNNIQFSSFLDGRQIELDHQNKTLYILSNEGIFTINMETQEIIIENQIIEGDFFQIASNKSYLISASPSNLFKYNISNNQIQLIEENITFTNRGFTLDPTENHLLQIGMNWTQNGYEIRVFSTDNINTQVHSFLTEDGIKQATYSTDNQYIYFTDYSSTEVLYSYDASSYQFHKTYQLFNSTNISDLIMSTTGSRIIAANGPLGYHDTPSIYFIKPEN